MQRDPRVAVITAAMCQGNKLEPVRDEFPERFFDVGICESHAVAFAAGLAKAGHAADRRHLQHLPAAKLRPDLPGSGAAEPAGRVHARPRRAGRARRADAPRRVRPDLPAAVAEPGRDGAGRRAGRRPRCSTSPWRTTGPTAIRYPKATAETVEREPAPIELGTAEVLDRGADGTLVACGTLLPACVRGRRAAARTRAWTSASINARFVKPLDTETILERDRAIAVSSSRSKKAR